MHNSITKIHPIYYLINASIGLFSPIYQNSHVSINQSQKNLKISNDIEQIFNDFSLFQIVYWHDNSPAGEVTNINSHQVEFSLGTKTIYGSINNFGENNSHTWLNQISQISHVDSTGNSGSYTYGNDGYDAKTRTPPWYKILPNYINLYIPKTQYSWVNITPNIAIDIRNIWKPYEKIGELNCKKVFQNGDQTDYVYNENEKIRFIKGINKDLNNKNYNVYAVPYTYIKESQFIYVVYNFVSRFVYSLQMDNNPNKTIFNKDKDNLIKLSNPFVNIFNPCQLLTIDHVNYNSHQIVFGINKDIVSFVNEYKLLQEKVKTVDFISQIEKDKLNNYCLNGKFDQITFKQFIDLRKTKYIDIDGFVKINISSFINKLKKYEIGNISEFIKIYDQLKKILKLRINYEIYNADINQFKKQFIDVNFDDLVYMKKAIDINQYENKYPFKIDSIDVLGYDDINICLLPSKNNFETKWSTNHISEDSDYLYIDTPQINEVVFNDIDSKYYDLYPSSISYQEIVSNFFKLYDENSFPLDISVVDNSDVIITPNDLLGNINVKINTTNGYVEKNFNNFKSFDIDKFSNIDASKLQYDLTVDSINNEIIDQILIANNFDIDILNNIHYSILDADTTKGEITIQIDRVENVLYRKLLGKRIKISNFLNVYLTQNNNANILNHYKPSEIDNEMFKNYLINISDGFRNLYGNDLKIKLEPNDTARKLVAKLSYSNINKEFVYQFSNKNKIVNYICFGIIGIGIIGLVTGFALYRRNKLTK